MKSSASERCPECYAEDPWKNETFRGFLIVVCDVCGYAMEGRVDEELDDEVDTASRAPVTPASVTVPVPPSPLSGDHADLVARIIDHFRGTNRGVRAFVNRVFPVRVRLEDFIHDRFGSSIRIFDHAPQDYMVTRLLESMDSDRVLAEVVNYSPSTSARVLQESVESGESFALQVVLLSHR